MNVKLMNKTLVQYKFDEYKFRMMVHRGKLVEVGGTSYLDAYNHEGGLIQCTPTPGLGYRSLTASNLTGKKGILITQSDDLQYSRGSKTQNNESVVYENFDPHQGTLEFWVRPNWDGNDGEWHYIFSSQTADTTNYVLLRKHTNNNLQLKVRCNSGTIRTGEVALNSTNFAAGSWHHIVGVWDTNNTVDGTNYIKVYLDETTTNGDTNNPGAPSLVASDFQIGQDRNNAYRFNGTIAGRILNRPATSSDEVASWYNSGAGSTDTFTVTPDTVWMGTYSDDDTDAVFQHRGQQATALTTTAVTVNEAVGNRSWADDDRFVAYDGTGYKKQGFITSTSGSTINVELTKDAADAVTDLDKVGVSLDFNATYNAAAVNNTVHQITTEDIGVSAWVRLDSGSSEAQVILQKFTGTTGYVFQTWTDGVILLYIKDGTDEYYVYGNTDIRDNEWHHIVGIIDRNDRSNCKIYLDGYEDGTTNYSGDAAALAAAADTLTNTAILYMGSRTGGNDKLDGQIRDVVFATSTDIMGANEMGASGEILTLATNPRDNTSVNSEDYWALNDNAASTTVAGNVNNLTASANTNTFSTQEAFISKQLQISDENGGIGGISLSTNAKIEKVTSPVKFDTRSWKLTNKAASNEHFDFAVAAANAEAYFVKGWVYTPSATTFADGNTLANINQTGDVTKTVANLLGAGFTGDNDWHEVYFVFTADGNFVIELHAGSIINNDYVCWDGLECRQLIAGDSLNADDYYTLIYDTDAGTTSYHWSGKGSQATEVQAGDLYIELDRDPASTATPSSSSNSFNTGKGSELNGSYLNDGLGTVTFSSDEIPTSKGTISFWANIQSPYDTGDDKVFCDARGANNSHRIKIYYQASSDKFVAYINGADRLLSSAQTGNTNFYTWIKVLLSYDFDNDKYALYINGVSVDTDATALTAPDFSSNNAFIYSDYLSTNQADAFIDEFQIYAFAMTAYQAKAHYYLDTPRWRW